MRDFLHIEDAIQGTVKAANSAKSGVYNIGTGRARSFKEIAEILQQELGVDLGIKYIPNPHLDYQLHTEADISSSCTDLGYNPLVSLEEGIKTYIPELRRIHKERGS